MTNFLHITVRWLDNRYHGLLGRDGPPEWPPSPYRLFQALVAGAARTGKLEALAGSLRWIETQPPPMIIAPASQPGQIVTRFVPNNDGDKKPDRQDRLTGKTFRPTIMLDDPAVHYLWECDAATREINGVIDAARSLICLGLGIDIAFAAAQFITEENISLITGIRWLPKPGMFRDGGMLRLPKDHSLDDLLRAHQSALQRIGDDGILKAVEKPRVFDNVLYASSERPIGRPYQLFVLRQADGEFFREAQAKLIHIAGMVRCAAIKAMKDYPPRGIKDTPAWVDSFVAGHRHRNGNGDHKQFSYVPLPSIGHENADCDVRRVMIVAPFEYEFALRHLAEQLDGCQLQRERGDDAPILFRLRGDGVTAQYTRPSATWATVTPIILPGHDDHKPAKTQKLIEAALRQSGVEQPCKFTWSAVPNFKNCLSAYKHDLQGRPIGYFRPDHLEGLTAVHARLTFHAPVPGPITIGAGRHCGFGVLAAVG